MVFFIIVLLVVGGLAWIRLAPSHPEVWHVDPQVTADQDLTNGVRRRIASEGDVFDRLHALILETPRTEVLAGSVSDGHVTYVTRSQWFGFPDYTTVLEKGGVLELWARARFGQSDLGVNKTRVERWLVELGQTAN